MNSKAIQLLSAKVEPVIITYNRASCLKKTLANFMSAGFNICKVHILDNASTDETEQVVREVQKQWPALIYHRNLYNIGGNANILRSLEIACSEYHWVIGDDDEWLMNEESLNELATVLQNGEADIVRLGWLVSNKSRGTLIEGSQLAVAENLFFASVSMISATIVKRDLLMHYLPQAYQGISASYPQLVPIIRSIEERNVKVHSLNKTLMYHTPSAKPGYFCGDLEWYACWFSLTRFFNHAKLRKKFVNEITLYATKTERQSYKQFIWLVKLMLYYKSFNLNQWPYLLIMLAYGSGWRLNIFVLMLINLFFPATFTRWLRKIYFRGAKSEIVMDRSRL
jgi:glycosyltransferase involved in cell wall biosynthesis